MPERIGWFEHIYKGYPTGICRAIELMRCEMSIAVYSGTKKYQRIKISIDII